MSLDLPLIWAVVIALAVLLYVLLDGFDLGIGILFPLARSSADRDLMMASIAPYWDGDETWLVLGGGGLFAAFPGAYAVLMPAFYLPIILMLLALILRGVAFEFRARGRRRGKRLWTALFSAGSLVAAVAQGLVLGGFVHGVRVSHGAFVGGPFDWLTPYALLTALGLVAGYALLGAAWLLIKTRDALHGDARRWARTSASAVAVLLAAVSVATLVVEPQVAARWGWTGDGFDLGRLARLAPIPLLGAAGLAVLFVGLARGAQAWPFAGAAIVFLSGYLGLAAGFFPYVAPYALTFRDAANADNALGLLFGGLVVILPVILGYTAWVYWLFRGKTATDAGYH
ncbi:MAG TPA: cytochrome d ubiquinol oxidase subunit II [Caulobacteraceae bacterium]|nr:cytochrome d ubiquinol oxidase subunit II [Caulobacteraceae bacterium]